MELVNRGKKMLIFVIVTCLSLSVFVTVLSAALLNIGGNPGQAVYELMQGLFRFVLECLLLMFVYRGRRWARIIALILFGISGIVSLISVFFVSYIMLILAVTYIASFIILLSKPVKMFQKYKKDGIVDDNSQPQAETVQQ